MLPMLPIAILKFTIKENIDNEQHIYIYTSKKIKKLSATAHQQHQIRVVKTVYGVSVKNSGGIKIAITAVFIGVYATFNIHHLTLLTAKNAFSRKFIRKIFALYKSVYFQYKYI